MTRAGLYFPSAGIAIFARRCDHPPAPMWLLQRRYDHHRSRVTGRPLLPWIALHLDCPVKSEVRGIAGFFLGKKTGRGR
jgi:hypothetical protein